MKKSNSKALNGFTIIEVTLVLAIAGLIFMMIFIALPALQRSQRDAQRRDDVMHYLDELKAYQQNNRGSLPSDSNAWTKFMRSYLGDSFIDPSGGNYTQKVVSCGADRADTECTDSNIKNIYSAKFPNDYTMLVVKNATCSGDRTIKTANPRNVSVLYRLEGAGVYCNSTSS